MTQEDKQLLLVDLCARVPYHPKGRVANARTGAMCDEWLTCATFPMFVNITNNCRLYLRPMSSMTEEESAELSNIISEWFDKELFYLTEEPFLEYALSKINYSISPLLFDWLNAHHFDYRGLIEKGLALEAPEDMYKEEQ